jgi:hypothetical protein
MYYRLTEMVIGQTIAVPLLSPPEQYCCCHVCGTQAGVTARRWKQDDRAVTIGITNASAHVCERF